MPSTGDGVKTKNNNSSSRTWGSGINLERGDHHGRPAKSIQRGGGVQFHASLVSTGKKEPDVIQDAYNKDFASHVKRGGPSVSH